MDRVARRKIALPFDADRARAFAVVAPLGQIDHVRAPVRKHPARKRQVPAKIAVAPRRNVRHQRGLPQPHFVVQRFRRLLHGLHVEQIAAVAADAHARVSQRQPHLDVFELADDSAADQLDQADVRVDRAVLRGRLKNAAASA